MNQMRRSKASAFQSCLRQYIRKKSTGRPFTVCSCNMNKRKPFLWISKCRKHSLRHFHSGQISESSAVLNFIYHFLVIIQNFSSFILLSFSCRSSIPYNDMIMYCHFHNNITQPIQYKKIGHTVYSIIQCALFNPTRP